MKVPQKQNNKASIFYLNYCFQAIHQRKRLCLVSREVLISPSWETRYKKLSNFQNIMQKVYFWTINLKTSCTLWLPDLSCLLHRGDREQANTFGRIRSLSSPITLRPLTCHWQIFAQHPWRMNSSLAELENGLKSYFSLRHWGRCGKDNTTATENYRFRLNRNCNEVSSREKPVRSDAGDQPEQNPAPAEGGRAIQTTQSRSDYLAADAEIKDTRETPRQTSN